MDKYKRVKIAICVSNTDIRPLELLQLNFGGDIVKSSNKFNTRMQLYRWSLYSRDKILYFLKNIYYYSVVKKKEIELAIEFMKTIEDKNLGHIHMDKSIHDKREEIHSKLRLLKRERNEPSNAQIQKLMAPAPSTTQSK